MYGNSTKVLLDAAGSGNLLYLPVDKLIQDRLPAGSGSASGGRSVMSGSGANQAQGSLRTQRENLRIRGQR